MTYDVLIIGAGMSGLAAGIQCAHFGKKVAILDAPYHDRRAEFVLPHRRP
ncbi:MAG: FAD-binding protein [Pirellulales bacterium]